jgi:hypothetical protein
VFCGVSIGISPVLRPRDEAGLPPTIAVESTAATQIGFLLGAEIMQSRDAAGRYGTATVRTEDRQLAGRIEMHGLKALR